MRAHPLSKLVLVAALATLGLAGCSSSRTGHAAIAMDPAGRLVAVVALCDSQRLRTLTLTDNTSGSAVTVKPAEAPQLGGTIILTGPIVNPRPEGVFDVLDISHSYTLSGTTRGPQDDDESGTIPPVPFTLDGVAKDPKLRQDAVLTPNGDEDGTEVIAKAEFVNRAKDECS